VANEGKESDSKCKEKQNNIRANRKRTKERRASCRIKKSSSNKMDEKLKRNRINKFTGNRIRNDKGQKTGKHIVMYNNTTPASDGIYCLRIIILITK
jgi:hypothetical protein